MARGKSGRAVKLSKEVIAWLEKNQRRINDKRIESYDEILRRLFGLPTRRGERQPTLTYFVLPNEGEPLIFQDKAEARGAAVIRAVRRGLKKAEAVVTVRGSAE